MCQVLKVSKGGYYKWVKATPSKRSLENKKLVKEIREIYKDSKGTYGSPRITAELVENNCNVSRPRVARIMKAEQIRAKRRKKYKVTTNSKHKFTVADNKLDRDFKPEELGKAWVSDITYIRTLEGWIYLTIVIDLADRQVVGWALSKDMHAHKTTIPALRMALRNRTVNPGLLFHSDRGVQYACTDFTNVLKANSIEQSMSRKGNCWDNAVAESFFKSLKVKCIYRRKFAPRKSVEIEVFEYIETWYNRKRKHSTLGYRTPVEFEQLLLNQKLVA